MVSIPNPFAAAISGFVFTLLLIGAPAAALGAFLGAAVGLLRSIAQNDQATHG